MIGVTAISGYIPETGLESADLIQRFEVGPMFLEKIGINRLAKKDPQEQASDLCVHAFTALQNKLVDTSILQHIDLLCICTQNGDYTIPQTSTIVQSKLGLPHSMATLDLGLGCAGYPYGLSVCKSFMEANKLRCGLFFTADPYSDILDMNDKNTALLFGDAAAVTLLTDDPLWQIGVGAFASFGEKYEALIKRPGQHLFMDGRDIFNLIMRDVPGNIESCLTVNGLSREDINMFFLHQANRHVIHSLARTMDLPLEKVPFDIKDYGNTVSSTLPLLFEKYLDRSDLTHCLLCGFGVGLQAASILLSKC
ncbi:ketoacyl-ACP synthase III [Desulfovibrio inopinatus]|uniref:ketoacyl-ACP synthase III n=1 Tax=Desulfovibrio inopinatus TaxID=102109 RepID=UPI0003F7B4B5|nr:ketoacyl-ACP synthase III [Desulfovibrio inopinatus]